MHTRSKYARLSKYTQFWRKKSKKNWNFFWKKIVGEKKIVPTILFFRQFGGPGCGFRGLSRIHPENRQTGYPVFRKSPKSPANPETGILCCRCPSNRQQTGKPEFRIQLKSQNYRQIGKTEIIRKQTTMAQGYISERVYRCCWPLQDHFSSSILQHI